MTHENQDRSQSDTGTETQEKSNMDAKAEQSVFATIYKMVMSKTVVVGKDAAGKDISKREKLGVVDVPIPTIADILPFLIDAKIIDKELDKDETDDGIPLYDNDVANWIQSAAVAKTEVKARNAHVPQTATLQDGKKIATNFAELLEAGERTGQAKKNYAEAVLAICAMIQAQGKSAQTVEMWRSHFRHPETVKNQTAAFKAKALEYLDSFVQSLEDKPELLVKYSKMIQSVEEYAKGEGVSEVDL